jgi:hypothetical protein
VDIWKQAFRGDLEIPEKAGRYIVVSKADTCYKSLVSHTKQRKYNKLLMFILFFSDIRRYTPTRDREGDDRGRPGAGDDPGGQEAETSLQ